MILETLIAKFFYLLLLQCAQVIQGRPSSVKLGHFPSIALIRVSDSKGYYAHCAGIILSQDTVLTAAHCKDNVNYKKFEVIVGATKSSDVYGAHSSYARLYLVNYVITSPKYDPRIRHTNDFMLLKLEGWIRMGSNVKPAVLSSSKTPPSYECTVVGWSSFSKGKDTLLQAKAFLEQNVFKHIVPVFENSNSLTGDAGGPLYCLDKNGRQVVHAMLVTANHYVCRGQSQRFCASPIVEVKDWLKRYYKR